MQAATAALILSLAGPALAHMRMTSPEPYGASTLNNSPLGNPGESTPYDFPCKQRTGVYDLDGASNSYAVGSKQTLAFVGEAVHGGGSCQVSLSQDLAPTNSSTFKVIHSIVGGCPAQGQPGNLGGDNDANAVDPWSYEYSIPKEVPAGDYTIAWTWFNLLGNREMYMNCGPVTITGDGGSQSQFDALPDIFVANIWYNPFSTQVGGDLAFPEPGEYIDYYGTASPIPPLSNSQTMTAPTPTAPASTLAAAYNIAETTIAVTGPLGGEVASYAGGPQGSAVDTGSVSAPATTTAPATSAANPSTSPVSTASLGGIFITTGTGDASPVPTTTAAVVVPSVSSGGASSAVVSSPAASSSASSGSGSSSGTQQTAGAACSSEGQYVCLGTSYQRCASGEWSVVMPLAAGTSCTGGTSDTLNLNVDGARRRQAAKRAVKFRA